MTDMWDDKPALPPDPPPPPSPFPTWRALWEEINPIFYLIYFVLALIVGVTSVVILVPYVWLTLSP